MLQPANRASRNCLRAEAAQADALVTRAKREIGIATDTAVKDLYSMAGQLATDVASRVIGKELNAAEHERLIAQSIEEFVGAGN